MKMTTAQKADKGLTATGRVLSTIRLLSGSSTTPRWATRALATASAPRLVTK